MYQIKVNTRDKEYLLYDRRDESLILLEPKLSLELNKTGALSFKIPPTHPHADQIEKMVSEISVYDDGELIYTGRPLSDKTDIHNTGEIPCEGTLAYLLDSIQRPFEFTGSTCDFFEQMLDRHNAQVEDRKRFKLGVCNVVDNNNYINRSNSAYSNTLDTLNDKLVKTHGGYLRVRYLDDGRYLDCISDYGRINSQVIRFGESILDLTRYMQADNLVTAVIPLGAQTDESGINDTKKRLTIESVNNGLDYIYDQDAVDQFGWIVGTVEFDDVTLPENLLAKGRAYLDECKNLSLTIELSAVDLHMLDVNIEKIQIGDWIRVVSKPHGLDKMFLVSKLELDLVNPQNNKITLGKTLATMTSSVTNGQTEFTKYVQLTGEKISSAIENATQLITGGKGGYVVTDMADDGHPQATLYLDRPSVEDAVNVLQINKNGLGFSNSGIKGPYRNAWTIDGNLLADFITAGTLRGIKIVNGNNTFVVDENGNASARSLEILNSNGSRVAWVNSAGHLSTNTLEVYGDSASSVNFHGAGSKSVTMQSDDGGNVFIYLASGTVTTRIGTYTGRPDAFIESGLGGGAGKIVIRGINSTSTENAACDVEIYGNLTVYGDIQQIK